MKGKNASVAEDEQMREILSSSRPCMKPLVFGYMELAVAAACDLIQLNKLANMSQFGSNRCR